jgi:hypothetical protein
MCLDVKQLFIPFLFGPAFVSLLFARVVHFMLELFRGSGPKMPFTNKINASALLFKVR